MGRSARHPVEIQEADPEALSIGCDDDVADAHALISTPYTSCTPAPVGLLWGAPGTHADIAYGHRTHVWATCGPEKGAWPELKLLWPMSSLELLTLRDSLQSELPCRCGTDDAAIDGRGLMVMRRARPCHRDRGRGRRRRAAWYGPVITSI